MPEVLNTTEVQAEARTMFSHSGLQGLIRLVCHELDETRTELKQLRHDYAILHTDAVVNAKSVGELEEQLAAAQREREQLIGAANFHALEQQAAEVRIAKALALPTVRKPGPDPVVYTEVEYVEATALHRALAEGKS